MEAFAIILMIFSFILAPHRVAAKIARVPVALLIALIHVVFKDKTKSKESPKVCEKVEAPYVAYVNTDGEVYEFFIPRRIMALYRRIKNMMTEGWRRSSHS